MFSIMTPKYVGGFNKWLIFNINIFTPSAQKYSTAYQILPEFRSGKKDYGKG